ncbi:MAG: hypothetical protein ACTHJ3_06105 [Pararhizobium sp.]
MPHATTGMADLESELVAFETLCSGLPRLVDALRASGAATTVETAEEPPEAAFSERFAELLAAEATAQDKAALLIAGLDRQRQAAEDALAALQASDPPEQERRPSAAWLVQRFVARREEPAALLFREMEGLLQRMDRVHGSLHLTSAAIRTARAVGVSRTARLIDEEMTLLGEVEAAQHELSAIDGEMQALKRRLTPRADRETVGEAVRDHADRSRESKTVAARARALRHEALALRGQVAAIRRLVAEAIDRSADLGVMERRLVALAEIATGLFAGAADLAAMDASRVPATADAPESPGLTARLVELQRLGVLARDDAERRKEATAAAFATLLARAQPPEPEPDAPPPAGRFGIRLPKRKR